ncbi:MAG TPA: cardiolipin synthase, partial [Thermoanaerobaculia bacterium]
VKEKPSSHLQVKQPGELMTLMPSLVGLTQGNLDQGNAVEVLQNGNGFFPLLFRDIRAARESVHIETYIWWKSAIGNELAKLLAEKARAGVEVRLLVDASGGKDLTSEQEEAIERYGGRIARFHPIRLGNLGQLNNRDHRKMMIIDGRIGYIGGYGIADEWTGNGQDKKHFRDTGLRVQGPIVNRLQGAFCENWVEESNEVPAGDKYFPKLPQAGSTQAHLAYASPSGSVSSVQILYYLAIKAARREIIIQNPYMLPDRDAIKALEEAVARGVDVKIMVPSDDATDNALVQHASHHHFGTLLARGVKVYEFNRTLLHQKVIIVDGIWSCVGSTNFDERSFQLNDEISMGVLDANVAAQLKAAWEADLRHAKQRKFEEWKDRAWGHKLVDGLAYLGQSQL